MKVLVTGAAGFIASQYVRDAIDRGEKVVVLDALSYAGHLENLSDVKDQIEFIEGDIRDFELLDSLYSKFEFDAVLNFAAESHVDNSITGPSAFIDTNIIGTFQMLEAARRYWSSLNDEKKKAFRYLQVSTDEVYGSLGETGKFSETTSYTPNSPYSASKAGADHLVRAWFHTYGLPTVITNCSNNYGQRQFPEKLIPVMITKALSGDNLPVYGDGKNVRDWIHVEDHCAGISLARHRTY